MTDAPLPANPLLERVMAFAAAYSGAEVTTGTRVLDELQIDGLDAEIFMEEFFEVV